MEKLEKLIEDKIKKINRRSLEESYESNKFVESSQDEEERGYGYDNQGRKNCRGWGKGNFRGIGMATITIKEEIIISDHSLKVEINLGLCQGSGSVTFTSREEILIVFTMES